MDPEGNVSFGVFKPVGHVVLAFPSRNTADAGAAALADLPAGAICRYTDTEMLAQIAHDMANASPLASIGQEMNLIKAQRALAQRGYYWLVVNAADDEHAASIAARAEQSGAHSAQYYGHFIIEELIQDKLAGPQVGESPDRGLDPQTPSGRVAERGREPRLP